MKYPLRASVYFANKFHSLWFVIPSWLYGIIWGTFPWIGWGAYSVESESKHRCSIDLRTQTSNVKSFNYSLLCFCYIIPIFIVIVSFVIIKKEMKKMLQFAKKATGKNSKSTRASIKSERLFTFVVGVMLTAFIVAWTPYAICVFYFSIKGEISEVVLDVASYLGKSSGLLNPIIYVFMYKEFRSAVRRLFGIRKNKVDNLSTSNPRDTWSHQATTHVALESVNNKHAKSIPSE